MEVNRTQTQVTGEERKAVYNRNEKPEEKEKVPYYYELLFYDLKKRDEPNNCYQ